MIRQRSLQFLALFFVAVFLSACAETQFIAQTVKQVTKKTEEKKRTQFGRYKIGKPYQIKGVWYYPAEDFEYVETGIASWYGPKFHGRKTANGETFDMNEVSAAHRTLPMPSFVRVTNLENGRSLNLRINDRGPFAHGRIIDLSRRASQLLGFQKQGTARVKVSILANESRAAAARLKGQAELAEVGSPITVESMPKPKVSTVSLPTVDAQETVKTPPPVETKPAVEKKATDQWASLPDSSVVTQEPVTPSHIFVQAGAFTQFENANRVRAMLSGLGPVKVSQVLVDDRDFYRVRIGPLQTVEEGDRMLQSVIAAGYPDARIIVD